jgi:hypothetical protein
MRFDSPALLPDDWHGATVREWSERDGRIEYAVHWLKNRNGEEEFHDGVYTLSIERALEVFHDRAKYLVNRIVVTENDHVPH